MKSGQNVLKWRKSILHTRGLGAIPGLCYLPMTDKFLQWLIGLIRSGDVHPFYICKEWKRLSRKVMRDDKWECQIHKRMGRYRRANLVHHQKPVKEFPSLALSRNYEEDGEEKRNLISVCRGCHETVCHPERLRKAAKLDEITVERWD